MNIPQRAITLFNSQSSGIPNKVCAAYFAARTRLSTGVTAMHIEQRFTLLLLLIATHSVSAQIVLDGSFGAAESLSGPEYHVTEQQGHRAGNNLFHSFTEFNINTGESVTFSGAAQIENVINRVTGDNFSNLDGVLKSDILGADIYLLNPNGIILGANAQLDLSGSLHLSTAAYVNLADGGRFDALNPDNDALTIAAPAAFGFLDNPAGLQLTHADLQIPAGERLTLLASDLLLDSVGITAPNGQVILQTASANSELSLLDLNTPTQTPPVTQDNTSIAIQNGSIISVPQNQGFAEKDAILVNTQGSLTIENATLETSEQNVIAKSGNINLAGHQVNINGSRIVANATGITETQGQGGKIVLTAEQLTLNSWINPATQNAQATLISSNARMGKAGTIVVNVGDTLTITGRSSLNASASRSADPPGQITINAKTLLMHEDGSINVLASNVTEPQTDKGKVSIIADTIELSGEAWIMGNTNTRNSEGGDVEITANQLTLLDEATIASVTLSDSQAGTIKIELTGALLMSGKSTITADTLNVGNAGLIEIQAGWIEMISGASITSDGELANAYVQRIERQNALLRQLGVDVSEISENRGNAGLVCVNASNQSCLAQNSLNALAVERSTVAMAATGCADMAQTKQGSALTVTPIQDGLPATVGVLMR